MKKEPMETTILLPYLSESEILYSVQKKGFMKEKNSTKSIWGCIRENRKVSAITLKSLLR